MDDSADAFENRAQQVPTSGNTSARAALFSLPFVRGASDGSEISWPGEDALSAGDCAERRIEGERWALDLLRYYRKFGHEPGARVLEDVVRAGLGSGPAGGEHLRGFLRVIDAMLAFAARQADVDAYAEALEAEHQRTLAAWKMLRAG